MSDAATFDPIEPPEREVERKKPAPSESWVHKVIRICFSPSVGTIFLAIVFALILSALIVVFFDTDVQATMAYFGARPGDFFAAAGDRFVAFFEALLRGAIYDWRQPTFAQAIRPLTESIVRSVPLIIAGLAIAVSFTAGLFNIGVQGQIIIGSMFGGFVGFAMHLPVGLHVLVAVIAAVIGGAIYGFIPGFLRAQLGANEVIVTIMLNSIAVLFMAAMLNTHTFRGEGFPGKSMKIDATAAYPLLLGGGFRLHLGFLVAILACIFVWWLLSRSTFGFELRMAGANPEAAQTAGVSVKRTLMLTLVVSGALSGLAATAPILGTEKALTVGMVGSIGFDAITVALLGKSKPVGVFFAGLLFGALNAGGAMMQSSAAIPVDIVQITQAIIVLMIAGSEAVRYMRNRRRQVAKTTEAVEIENKETPVQEGATA